MRKLPFAIKLGILGVFAAAALLLGITLLDSTPQSAEAGSSPAMSLRVDASQQTSCPSPTPGKVCVGVGAKFDVIVVADAIPPSGYILAQAWIDYDNQGLVHKNNTVALWPDCDSRTFLTTEDVANNGAQAGCLTFLGPTPPPSFHVGDLFSFSLTCTGSSSSSSIQLLPEGAPPANTFGALYVEAPDISVVPAVTGITVSCVPQSTPTPGPPPAMSLRVDNTVSCPSPTPGKVCVGFGAKFDVIVVADAIPAPGYVLAQAWIDYDNQGLVHKNNTVALWPDCDSRSFLTTEDVANNGAQVGCLTDIDSLPPSFHVDDLFSFSLTCTGGQSSSSIQLLPEGAPPANTLGALYAEFGTNAQTIPAVTGITVSCVEQSAPGPTSTITPTPTGTSPTDTPTPTGTLPPVPAMSLRVDNAFLCPGGPQAGQVCVGQGQKFSVIAVADDIPPSGYTLTQAWIDYDNQGLVHKKNTQALWPDCHIATLVLAQDEANNGASAGCLTGVLNTPPSFHIGDLFSFSLTCTAGQSSSQLDLIPYNVAPAGTSGALFVEFSPYAPIVPAVSGITVNCVTPPQPEPGDTDGDGCSDQREVGPDETLGGLRDFTNPHDFYDVLGPFGSLTLDGVIDLPNDILGVIQHFSPQGQPPYDVRFDRGPQTGANVWNLGPPDGVIDLPNDILGVIQQFGHNCV